MGLPMYCLAIDVAATFPKDATPTDAELHTATDAFLRNPSEHESVARALRNIYYTKRGGVQTIKMNDIALARFYNRIRKEIPERGKATTHA